MRVKKVLQSLQSNIINVDSLRHIIEDSGSYPMDRIRFGNDSVTIKEVGRSRKPAPDTFHITFTEYVNSDDLLYIECQHELKGELVMDFTRIHSVPCLTFKKYKLILKAHISAEYNNRFELLPKMQEYLYIYMTQYLQSNEELQRFVEDCIEFPESIAGLCPISPSWMLFHKRTYISSMVYPETITEDDSDEGDMDENQLFNQHVKDINQRHAEYKEKEKEN